MIEELELNEAQATAVIEKAQEFEVYDDEMPETKKEKLSAAHEIVAFAVDSWVNDGVRPDAKDKKIKKAAAQVEEIFELAGIEVDDDGDISYGDAPDASGDDDDDDEAPVDINDVIDGYEDLSVATKLKKVKALELDPEDDDDFDTAAAIFDWENEQDKPASRVLNFLEEAFGEGAFDEDGDDDKSDDDDADADDDADDDDDETADDSADADDDDEPYTEKDLKKLDKEELKEVYDEFDLDNFPKRFTDAGKTRVIKEILEAQEEADDDDDSSADADGSAEELEEPWEDYDETSLKDAKEVVNDEERTLEELQYILEYEEAADKPRASLVTLLNKRIEELSEDDDGDDDDDDEPEEKPAKGRRGRGRAKAKDEDDDEPKAKGKSKSKAEELTGNRVVAKIGDSELIVTMEGTFAVAGLVADLLGRGDVDEITVTPA